MKQIITVLALALVALLLVSGFIAAGSVQQSQQLAARTAQMNELKTALLTQQKAGEAADAQIETLNAELESRRKDLKAADEGLRDALLAVEEANGAIAERSVVLEETETAHLLEKEGLAAALSEREQQAAELLERCTQAETMRDEALARVKEQETALAALNEEMRAATVAWEAQQQANAEALELAQTEADAYIELLALWNRARMGQAAPEQVDRAEAFFREKYPDTLFTLPQGEPPQAQA
ncbi:MAG: hypothetical protein RR367_04320, partial [Clostridia bacterium]